jgi:hypothetical protein
MALLFFLVHANLEICHIPNNGENGCLSLKGSGYWALGGSGNLAFIKPRGGTTQELLKRAALFVLLNQVQ